MNDLKILKMISKVKEKRKNENTQNQNFFEFLR